LRFAEAIVVAGYDLNDGVNVGLIVGVTRGPVTAGVDASWSWNGGGDVSGIGLGEKKGRGSRASGPFISANGKTVSAGGYYGGLVGGGGSVTAAFLNGCN